MKYIILAGFRVHPLGRTKLPFYSLHPSVIMESTTHHPHLLDQPLPDNNFQAFVNITSSDDPQPITTPRTEISPAQRAYQLMQQRMEDLDRANRTVEVSHPDPRVQADHILAARDALDDAASAAVDFVRECYYAMKYDQALQIACIALRLLGQLHGGADNALTTDTLTLLISVQLARGDIPSALRSAAVVLRTQHVVSNIHLWAHYLGIVAYAHMCGEQFHDALALYTQQLKIIYPRGTPSALNVAYCLYNIVCTCHAMGPLYAAEEMDYAATLAVVVRNAPINRSQSPATREWLTYEYAVHHWYPDLINTTISQDLWRGESPLPDATDYSDTEDDSGSDTEEFAREFAGSFISTNPAATDTAAGHWDDAPRSGV